MQFKIACKIPGLRLIFLSDLSALNQRCMSFKDHFSKQSDLYLQARPGYPDQLFSFLASLVTAKETAWDCGTGNGQAAIPLTKYFARVLATDPSEAQIKNAIQHEKIQYSIAKAESSGLRSASVDLITCAAAIHWFDHSVFYPEAKRILKPGGIIAAWTYSSTEVNDQVNPVIGELAHGLLKEYWPAENNLVWEKYKELPFPFIELQVPEFICELDWNLQELCAYLNTWSSTQRYIKANGTNPVDLIWNDLENAWGKTEERKKVKMELSIKVGRND